MLDGDPAEDEFVSVQGYHVLAGWVSSRAASSSRTRPRSCATGRRSPTPRPSTAACRGSRRRCARVSEADGAATDHKLDFFANGATPNMVVTTPESVMTQEQFDDFKRKPNQQHVGAGKRYKTLISAPGADVERGRPATSRRWTSR